MMKFRCKLCKKDDLDELKIYKDSKERNRCCTCGRYVSLVHEKGSKKDVEQKIKDKINERYIKNSKVRDDKKRSKRIKKSKNSTALLTEVDKDCYCKKCDKFFETGQDKALVYPNYNNKEKTRESCPDCYNTLSYMKKEDYEKITIKTEEKKQDNKTLSRMAEWVAANEELSKEEVKVIQKIIESRENKVSIMKMAISNSQLRRLSKLLELTEEVEEAIFTKKFISGLDELNKLRLLRELSNLIDQTKELAFMDVPIGKGATTYLESKIKKDATKGLSLASREKLKRIVEGFLNEKKK